MLDIIFVKFPKFGLSFIVLFHKLDKVRSSKPLVIKLIIEVKFVTNLNRA